MKAIRMHQPGGTEVLRLEEIAQPQPGPGEVLIKVMAAGVNYADVGMRRGMFGGPHSATLPFTPGFDVAGTIAASGPGVTGWEAGMRAMAVADIGGYAEYAVAPADKTFRMPRNMNFAPATALLVQGLTAYGLIHDAAKVQRGESVLVQSAAGGVGSLLLQLARLAGAGSVIGTASGGKLDVVRELGADAAIDYTQPDWSRQVYEATQGRGVDVVLDGVSGRSAAQAFGSLAPLGRMIMFGGASGEPLPFHEIMMPMQMKGLTLGGFGGPWLRPGRAAAAAQALTEYVERGELRIDVTTFPLAEAAAAHAAIEARQTTGKVVLIAGEE
jgi:NADPH:quinone reductase